MIYPAEKPSLVCLFARELGLRTLTDGIADQAFDIKAVVTHYYQPGPHPLPRKRFSAFADVCDQQGIPLVVVGKNQENLKILKHLEFDFLVANCYRFKIPLEIIDLARISALNMHRSLLPKYKGAKPLKQALAARDTRTGTTVHHMTDIIDSGEIVAQHDVPIAPGDTEASLFEKLYPTQYPLMKHAIFKLLRRPIAG